MTTADQEIEGLKAAVGRHFTIYGVIVSPLALTFQVAAPGDTLDQAFDALRTDLVPKNYIPTVTRERGELLLHIQRRPSQKFAGLQVNVVMLVVTVITTVFFGGAWNWGQYVGENWLSLDAILNGTIYFTLPLLAILGFHEMAHFVVARRYHLQASLPFFLPSVPPLGTFGAFISMRDPLPNRRALLDLGASGPLVGFAIAIPVTIAGLFLTAANPRPLLPVEGSLQLIQPSVFYAFLSLFFPVSQSMAMHPLAFAGWVGLFVTAINLLPAGQLDGGHIARALLGERQGLVSWAAIGLLVFMSLFYVGWLIFAFLILLIGVRHPPPLNDLSRLGIGRKLIGIGAVAILLLTFVPQPFQFTPLPQGIAYEAPGGGPLPVLNASLPLGAVANLSFAVNNTGATPADVTLSFQPQDLQNLNSVGFTLFFANVTVGNRTDTSPGPSQTSFTLAQGERALVTVRVDVPSTLSKVPSTWVFVIHATTATAGSSADLTVNLIVS